jgi:hypothetical protein
MDAAIDMGHVPHLPPLILHPVIRLANIIIQPIHQEEVPKL